MQGFSLSDDENWKLPGTTSSEFSAIGVGFDEERLSTDREKGKEAGCLENVEGDRR